MRIADHWMGEDVAAVVGIIVPARGRGGDIDGRLTTRTEVRARKVCGSDLDLFEELLSIQLWGRDR